MNFILATLFWTIALYGLLEIIKKIINSFTYSKLKENTYIIIAVKNGETYIEGSLRTILSKISYDDKTSNEIIVVDLNSNDMTKEILYKIGEDNKNIKIMNWKKCKDIIDKVNLTSS